MYSKFTVDAKIEESMFDLYLCKSLFVGTDAMDENALADYTMLNILDNLTKYDISKPIVLTSLLGIIKYRKRNVGSIKSGHLGMDTEVFFTGFLKHVIFHKILTTNNSLEAADSGIDIISMANERITLSEVKSSTLSGGKKNQELVVKAIISMFISDSKLGDQNLEMYNIVDPTNYTDEEINVIKKYIEDPITNNVSHKEHIFSEFMASNLDINIMLLTPNAIEIEQIASDLSIEILKIVNEKKEDIVSTNIINQLIDDERSSNIKLYHIKLKKKFSIDLYFDTLIERISKL